MTDFVERYRAARSEDAQRALLATATQEERDALAASGLVHGNHVTDLEVGREGHPNDWTIDGLPAFLAAKS